MILKYLTQMFKVERAYRGKKYNRSNGWMNSQVMRIEDIDDALIKHLPLDERCKIIRMMDHSSLESAATSYEATARYCLEEPNRSQIHDVLGNRLLGEAIGYRRTLLKMRGSNEKRKAELPKKLRGDFEILDQLKAQLGF